MSELKLIPSSFNLLRITWAKLLIPPSLGWVWYTLPEDSLQLRRKGPKCHDFQSWKGQGRVETNLRYRSTCRTWGAGVIVPWAIYFCSLLFYQYTSLHIFAFHQNKEPQYQPFSSSKDDIKAVQLLLQLLTRVQFHFILDLESKILEKLLVHCWSGTKIYQGQNPEWGTDRLGNTTFFCYR